MAIFLRTKLASQWEGKGGGGRKKWIPSFLPPFLNRFLPMKKEKKGNRSRRICPPNFYLARRKIASKERIIRKVLLNRNRKKYGRNSWRSSFLPLLLPVSHPHTLPPKHFFPLKDPPFPISRTFCQVHPPPHPLSCYWRGEDDSYDHRRRSEKGGQIKRQGCQVFPGIRCSSSAMSGARSQAKKLGKRGGKIKVFLAHLATRKV